jgi:beta-N-acetylhexosaminidase
VLAVRAGCDVLLVCSREDLADEVHAALVREAEASPVFRARCEEARARALAMRRRVPPRPVAESDLERVFAASAPIRSELQQRLAAGSAA